MTNPWKNLHISIYEDHMSSKNVKQLQALNRIMKSQIESYNIESIMIWGIAGGNGLEHINHKINNVIGIDINTDYLEYCKKRYEPLKEKLKLYELDITKKNTILPYADLIIANMIIEYIGINNFSKKVKESKPKYVSCVFQKNSHEEFVSKSPHSEDFKEISDLHQDVLKVDLDKSMGNINMLPIKEEKYILTNEKSFLRVDYEKNG